MYHLPFDKKLNDVDYLASTEEIGTNPTVCTCKVGDIIRISE